jgi:hypothetical protein
MTLHLAVAALSARSPDSFRLARDIPLRPKVKPPMSLMGQSRHFSGAPLTSGLPRRADILGVRRHVGKVPIASLRTAASGKPFCPLSMRYTLINSPPPRRAAIDNADPCSYSRQKMQRVPARCPRFSSRLSWDAAGNWHSDLRSIDRLPPLLHPSTCNRCCG